MNVYYIEYCYTLQNKRKEAAPSIWYLKTTLIQRERIKDFFN